MASEGGGYLRGLVTGVLVGAATALLLAPKRGEDIRQDLAESAERLKEKAEDFSGQISDKAHDIKERGSHLVEVARDKSSGLIAAAGNKADDWQDETFDADGDLIGEAGAPEKTDQSHDVVDSV